MKGILGRKAGMTTVFANDGRAVPVTVIEVKPNIVFQVKTKDIDGYDSIKLGVEDKKEQKTIKPELGQAKKANTSAKYFLKEIKNMVDYSIGQKIDLSIFEIGEYVDVTGTSKGKGFQGSIKRHNQSRGPMSHGSKSHRVTGSLGDIRGTVKKTKKMPGHMGHVQVTMQNLEIVEIDLKNNILLIKGSIPGPNKSFVVVKNAIKKQKTINPIELVNVKEEKTKNDLLEKGKKVGAQLNTSMSAKEMNEIIEESTKKHNVELQEYKEYLIKAKELEISKAESMKLSELKAAVSKAEEIINMRKEKNLNNDENKNGGNV